MQVTLVWVPETSPRALGRAAVISLVLIVACGRSVRTEGDGSSAEAGSGSERGGSGGDVGGTAGYGGTGGKGGTSGASGEAGEPDCLAPEAPIRRLNRFEYNNTVRDLFGDDSRPADALPPDFYDDAQTPASAELVEGYAKLARDFAESVTADDEATKNFIGCDPNDESEAICRDRFLTAFVTKAFRRPFSTQDDEEFTSVFATGQTLGQNFRSGVRAVVEVALQSPEFLYRPELGEPSDRDGWARPTPYEMASRLSYLYWGSAPDTELLDAAERGDLGSAESVRAQAERLLGDPKARDVVGYFYMWLLRLHGATYPASGDPAYPTFTPEIAALLPRETTELANALTFDAPGSFESLFVSPFTVVNGPLASFYGMSGVSGDDFRQVPIDGIERVGVLTDASFLASNALGTLSHPARRGWLIMNALLCTPVPEEPGDIPPPTLPDGKTGREMWEELTSSNAACAGCHALVNPLGFAFEHYDGAGLFRETDNGLPIDATGTLSETDAAGSFDGARELSELLSESADARRCFVRNWFSFSQGRSTADSDACFIDRLDEAFVNDSNILRSLAVELSQSDAFLYRPEVQ